jgi:hypothetical protein
MKVLAKRSFAVFLAIVTVLSLSCSGWFGFAENVYADDSEVQNETQEGKIQIPDDAVEYNGHRYYFYYMEVCKSSWEDAIKFCENKGGYLATINDKEENDFLNKYMRENTKYTSAYFGLSDRIQEGTWVWENGENSTYTNWASGEANSQNSREDYGMFYYKYPDGTWNDGDYSYIDDGKCAIICEWGFTLQRDNLSFTNTEDYFFTDSDITSNNKNYNISENAKNQILSMFDKNNTAQELITKHINDSWTGSCQGMSTLMSVMFYDYNRLHMNDIGKAYSLACPKDSSITKDLVNSYHLMYYTPAVQNNLFHQLCQTFQNYTNSLNNLVESVKDASVPTVAWIKTIETNDKDNKTVGHAILLLDVLDEDDDSYTFKLYDPNYLNQFRKMTVYKENTSEKYPYYISINYLSFTYLYWYSTNIDTVDPYECYHKKSEDQGYEQSYIESSDTDNINVTTDSGKNIITDGIPIQDFVYGPLPGPAVTTDGTNNDNHSCYLFDKELSSNYIVDFDDMKENGSVDIITDNFGATLSTVGDGTLSVDTETNTITAQVDDKPDTELSVVTNDTDDSWEWCKTTVKTDDSQTITIKLTEDGAVISGDNPDDQQITVSDLENEKEIESASDNERTIIDKSGNTKEDFSATTVSLSASTFNYNGQSQKPEVTVKDKDGNTLKEGTDYTIQWPEDTTSAGEKEIVISGIGNYSGTQSVKYSIIKSGQPSDKTDLSTTTVSLSASTFTYNGESQKPEVTVKDKDGNTLKEGTDYTIQWPEDTTSAGEKEIVISGIGDYTGTKSVKYTISNSDDTSSTEVQFTDVHKGDWFYDAVYWAVAEGITEGTSETTFSPDMECTRAHIVTFLWRANGSPEVASTDKFSDVADDQYYSKAVAWAVQQGITVGTSDTTFSPDMPCTRAQAVTFLWRAKGSPDASASSKFNDVDSSQYYANAVDWAVKNNITAGTSDTTFSPNVACSRAQIVAFLYRAK